LELCGKKVFKSMLPFSLLNYPRVKRMNSFNELLSTPFSRGINAFCWPRLLEGDFKEVISVLGTGQGVRVLEESALSALSLSAAGRRAADFMLEDLRLLQEAHLDPVLNCIYNYPSDETELISTDVYSFHVDSAPFEMDTWLCTYYGPASEGLLNEEAQPKVEQAALRAELLKLYGGEDDAAFAEYLKSNCYDLHYLACAGARPYSFGLGNLWRIAARYPEAQVPPCIHRAPRTLPGQSRLLLIS
jgi:hypothetical protein